LNLVVRKCVGSTVGPQAWAASVRNACQCTAQLGRPSSSFPAGPLVDTASGVTTQQPWPQPRDGRAVTLCQYDLVGVCTTGDHPPFVVDVTMALPHNPNEPGAPVPAGTAANKAVARKRETCGVNHTLTTGFHVAALERFVYCHPEAIRQAKTLAAAHTP
jgi:hypothetical protein